MTSPIQNTNIERVLEDHLWVEISLLEERIKGLMEEIELLDGRKEKLESIAEAAGIERPNIQA